MPSAAMFTFPSFSQMFVDCEIKKGNIVAGKITKVLPCKGLTVQLPGKKLGMVFPTDIRDDFKENPTEDYQLNQLVRSVFTFGH